MALEVPLDAGDLEFPHGVLAGKELRHGQVGVQLDAEAVELALAKSGEEDRRLTQRLAWQGPRVNGRAAGLLGALDAGDAFAEVRSLGSPLFAGRSHADDDEIVVVRHGRETIRSSTIAFR